MKGEGQRPDQKCCRSSNSLSFLPSFPHFLCLPPSLPSHRPDWAGEGLVSSLVSALINNKFLYGFMKIGARKVRVLGGERRKGKRTGSMSASMHQ